MFKKHWCISPIFALLILSISACSNVKSNGNNLDDKFELELNYFLKDEDSSIKVAYQELFGIDKSIKEAKEYCMELDQGKSQLGLLTVKYDELNDKIKGNTISAKERDAIINVYHAIYYAAQDIYCPQHRDKEQIPLNERLKN